MGGEREAGTALRAAGSCKARWTATRSFISSVWFPRVPCRRRQSWSSPSAPPPPPLPLCRPFACAPFTSSRVVLASMSRHPYDMFAYRAGISVPTPLPLSAAWRGVSASTSSEARGSIHSARFRRVTPAHGGRGTTRDLECKLGFRLTR